MVGCGQREASGLYYWKSALENAEGKSLERDFIAKQAYFHSRSFDDILSCGFQTTNLRGHWICKQCAIKLGLIW